MASSLIVNREQRHRMRGRESTYNPCAKNEREQRERERECERDREDEPIAYEYNPLNPLNCEITEEDVCAILRKYGVPAKVHNIALYRRAFVHSSYTRHPTYERMAEGMQVMPLQSVREPEGCVRLKTKSNERLEFLGDGVLECVIKFHIYRRFPKENEGFMTEKKIAVVKNMSIGKIAQEMGLQKWLLISKVAEDAGVRTNLKKLGCLFEAFVGALFLDTNQVPDNDSDPESRPASADAGTDGGGQGLEVEEGTDLSFWHPNHMKGFHMAMRFIENVFQEHVDWVEILQKDDNYKALLQVQIQKEFRLTPYYLEYAPHSDETGYSMTVVLCIGQAIHDVKMETMLRLEEMPAEQANFAGFRQWMMEHNGTICVRLGDGRNHNKRKAEQFACRSAMARLQLLGEGV